MTNDTPASGSNASVAPERGTLDSINSALDDMAAALTRQVDQLLPSEHGASSLSPTSHHDAVAGLSHDALAQLAGLTAPAPSGGQSGSGDDGGQMQREIRDGIARLVGDGVAIKNPEAFDASARFS